jgi:hypothetical protein
MEDQSHLLSTNKHYSFGFPFQWYLILFVDLRSYQNIPKKRSYKNTHPLKAMNTMQY